MKNDFEYIIFVLGRDLLRDYLPKENDLAYEICQRVATDFQASEYDTSTKGLYECLEDYVRDRKEKKYGRKTIF